MAWIYLVLAGLCEIGWPVGLKLAQKKPFMISGIIIAFVCIVASGFLLYLAQRVIVIGTAYAVWTAIGAVGTFLVGVIFFSDPQSFIRYMGVSLIIAGVIVLKLADNN